MLKIFAFTLSTVDIFSIESRMNAGSATETGFDQSATIDNLQSNTPQSAKITDTRYEELVQPSGNSNKYRSMVTWE